MLILLVAMTAGVVLGLWVDVPVWCAIVCLIAFYIVSLGRQRSAELTLLVAFAMAGVVLARTEQQGAQPTLDEPLTMLMTIDDNTIDRSAWQRSSATLRAFRKEGDSVWHDTHWRVVVNLDSSMQLAPNQRIAIHATVRPLADSTNSYVRLMRSRGYVGRVSIHRSTPLADLGVGGALRTASRKLQNWGVERLQATQLQGDQLALCTAIATGSRATMSAPLREAYTRSGSAHLLAVSGLHVAIIFVLANILLRWLTLFGRGIQMLNVAVIVVIWAYAAVTGLAVSVVRAALMFSALQIAMASASSYRSANVLATVAMVMIAVRPSVVLDVSFQLSTAAVAAIIYWVAPIYEQNYTRSHTLNTLLSTILVGVVCTLATAPLVAYWFGRVAVVGVVLNPLVVALGYGLVTLSVAAMILPATWHWVARAAGAFAEAENRCVAIASQLDWASTEVRLDSWQVVVIYAVAVAITELIRRKTRKNRYLCNRL